ncbi:MAG TPA: DNA topoisomerase 4 subunit A, partial [Candidatus Pacearchaeota archaeon]|nr:DNA topoisomerase 4 subunit A [Candidatus Pacearchaeota archaeon]
MPKENKKEDKQKKTSPTQSFRAREIIEEMKESYLDYAMSVIVARALPDVRDGLKPVQRRILYSMYEIGLGSGSKTRKSALVIGDVLGKYHPHGDASVYDAMARMAQDFSLRYPLVQGQGNFGSIDGDPPAAYRYTEAKLAKVADQLLNDIDRNTVDFIDNYDGTRKEPTVLPALLPNLLLNGTMGIAVGMATNIPPHNLGEICDACNYLLDHPKADTEDLFQFVKGPDFPTGGIIYDQKGILAAYSQGRGPIVIRGKAEITEDKQGRPMIIITEIPYQVVKSSLVEQLAALVEEKRVVGIRDIRDESGKEGVRIVIHLTKDVPPQKVLNQLYKYSDLQKSFHLNLLALVGGIQPKVLSLAEALSYYLEHREIVTRRRIAFDLEKAKQRAHILEGLAKCLADIDEVIAIIRRSEDREDAMRNLMKRFKIDEIQANAILETKLAHLAKLERKKIDEELKALKAKIKELNDILGDPKKVKEVMKGEIAKLRAEAGDDRRTKVLARKIEEFSDEDLIPQEEVVITITNSGYIKRMNPEGYRLQKRGGKGSSGMKVSEEDIVEHFVTANTHDSLLFFTNSGKVFRIPAYEVPEGTKGAKGRALMNFLEISANE